MVCWYILAFVLVLSSCNGESDSSKHNGNSGKTNRLKIGLALGLGGLGDLSYNDMLYNGLIEVSRSFDVDIAYEVPKSGEEADIAASLQKLVDAQCAFIIGGAGWLMIDPIDKLAKIYTNTRFALIDDFAKNAPNVCSVVFAQNEGSYVVGILAAGMTKTGKIGFIGGVDIPVIKSFLAGFQAGIQSVGNKKLMVEYVSSGDDFSGFGNPKKGNEIARSLYTKGVDIIYSVAGATGTGIIEAARASGKFVIGVDYNQDYLAKGFVLTSMMKRLDNAVLDIAGKFVSNQIEGAKIYLYGYKNKGVSITSLEYTKDIIPGELQKKLADTEEKIASGQIIVPDYKE